MLRRGSRNDRPLASCNAPITSTKAANRIQIRAKGVAPPRYASLEKVVIRLKKTAELAIRVRPKPYRFGAALVRVSLLGSRQEGPFRPAGADYGRRICHCPAYG
jgi:hypothetical protein